ncbi:DNA polymerase III subunit alpha [Rhodobacterales bacterium 52_120_T64]|nr:DNA polymerase III subunit alpha [Rhodobacterales bacterium 52_120_T64]
MKNTPRFIHLRVHSAYSLLEGAIHLKKLPQMCADWHMPAVAVTDSGNLFGALEFSETASKAGIQPIVGCQFQLKFETASRPGDREPAPKAIVLLAQNERGYENLMKLNSCNFLECGDELPHITMAQLSDHADGLICMTGGSLGPIGQLLQDGQKDKARLLTEHFQRLFADRLYIEIQRHPTGQSNRTPAENATEPGFVQLAYDLNIPLVATNDVYFPKKDMYAAHDALICIAEGAYVDQQEPRRQLTPEHYFKTPEEMDVLFSDLPEAIANTIEIAKRCAFKAYLRDPILPKFANNEVEALRELAHEGLKARLAVIPHAVSVKEYEDRLDFELGVIENMGFPGYFLIVADFIHWAKEQDIPVGPGRGSGAGSLVAYSLTITDLDPLRYSLLFERFLNPERVSMPDFDIDFCMDRREEVIQYVQQKYGRDKVAQIITFGALLSKAAVRDIGRVLQMPYGQVDRISKLIPVDGVKPVSIAQALQDEPRLKEMARDEEVVARLLEYAQQVEGLLRNASTHAAGVVIGDRPLDELVPLYQDPRSDMPATQFNMKWVEPAGLVKFDFLGLKTLTVIQNALDLLKLRDINVDISAIPIDDKKTYELYASANTVAVFQVESTGMMDALRQMQPNCIEDIIALVALYRPGPMENIPKFCDVKNDRDTRDLLHPSIDHLLDETQGIIVYQEQVMQIAQEMAGYSLGGADMLRRAMGKKIKEAMDAERPKFNKGAAENGVDEAKATEVFDLLEKFANYGFNKSHAAAYAVVSYQTAWLKANHPVEFMAGVMNCDIHLTDKLAVYSDEVRKSKERGGLGIEIIPPCVNRSRAAFSVKDGKVVYGMGGLKNVGSEAMKLITSARDEGNTFKDLFDFARRVDLKRVGKRPMEMLARSGAFDQLDGNRRKVLESIDKLVAYSAACNNAKNSSQHSLFGDSGDDLPPPRLPMPEDWEAVERLTQEHTAFGFYLTGHPLDDYMPALKRERVLTLEEVTKKAEGRKIPTKMAGTISAVQIRKSARGNRFAFISLSDPSGHFEVTVFADVLESAQEILKTGENVVMPIEADGQGGQLKLLARGFVSIDTAVADTASVGLRVFLNDAEAVPSVATRLMAKDAGRAVKGPVNIVLIHPDLPGEVEITLPDDYAINAKIKGAIKHIGGVMRVEEF